MQTLLATRMSSPVMPTDGSQQTPPRPRTQQNRGEKIQDETQGPTLRAHTSLTMTILVTTSIPHQTMQMVRLLPRHRAAMTRA